MSKTTVFLVVSDLTGLLSSDIIALSNARNNARADLKGVYVNLEEGATYADLRTSYKDLYSPMKGYGSLRMKDGNEYWALPFTASAEMTVPDPLYAIVLDRAGYLSFGWDIEEIE